MQDWDSDVRSPKMITYAPRINELKDPLKNWLIPPRIMITPIAMLTRRLQGIVSCDSNHQLEARSYRRASRGNRTKGCCAQWTYNMFEKSILTVCNLVSEYSIRRFQWCGRRLSLNARRGHGVRKRRSLLYQRGGISIQSQVNCKGAGQHSTRT